MVMHLCVYSVWSVMNANVPLLEEVCTLVNVYGALTSVRRQKQRRRHGAAAPVATVIVAAAVVPIGETAKTAAAIPGATAAYPSLSYSCLGSRSTYFYFLSRLNTPQSRYPAIHGDEGAITFRSGVNLS